VWEYELHTNLAVLVDFWLNFKSIQVVIERLEHSSYVASGVKTAKPELLSTLPRVEIVGFVLVNGFPTFFPNLNLFRSCLG